MPTIEDLTKDYLEKAAAAQAETTLDHDIRRVIKAAQFRQKVYLQALPAADLGDDIEWIEWWSRTVKVVAVVAVGMCVAAYVGPLAVSYLADTSAGAWYAAITKTGITITGAIGSKSVTLTAVSAAGLMTGLAAKGLTGTRWPTLNPKLPRQGDLSLLYLDREDHAMPGTSAVGLLFDFYYRSKLASAIDAIEHSLMPGGLWPGWENVKIIPSIIQDEYQFITGLDKAVYGQIVKEGATPGKAYLKKVQILLGFWTKLEDFLIQHRIHHGYQQSIPALKAAADAEKATLDKAVAAQKK